MVAGAVSLCLALPLEASAWDSQAHNPTHSTHSHITEWAMDRAAKGCAEIGPHRAAVLDGANRELHELPVTGSAHGLDLEAARSRHRGTNAGCDDIEGWWDECLAAYRAGDKDKAFFLLGVMLHMIEDMGVPAHANGVYHQGNPVEFDNFEYMALWNWKPSFESIDRKDPAYSDPWRYYAFSREWAHADAPDYHDRSTFSKTWLFASREERRLLRNRQGRTCTVTLWALESACRAFEAKPGVGAQRRPATGS